MTVDQINFLQYLGFAALGAAGFGPILYAMGRQAGRARGVRDAFRIVAARDAEIMRREQERQAAIRKAGDAPK